MMCIPTKVYKLGNFDLCITHPLRVFLPDHRTNLDCNLRQLLTLRVALKTYRVVKRMGISGDSIAPLTPGVFAPHVQTTALLLQNNNNNNDNDNSLKSKCLPDL